MRELLPLILCCALSAQASAQSDPFGPPLPDYDRAALDAMSDRPDPGQLYPPVDLSPPNLPNLLTPESSATAGAPSQANARDPRTLPTKFDFSYGPVKFDFETGFTPHNSAASPPLFPSADAHRRVGAGGGSGAVHGEVRYDGTDWNIYGRQTFGAAQSGSAPLSVHENTLLGGLYNLPGWMAGGKLGASVLLAPEQDPTARVEYRHSFGPAEAFLAAERRLAPEVPGQPDPPATVRGGINQKF
jgi:hypothetical protein